MLAASCSTPSATLHPVDLSETGRREILHVLRTVELRVAIALPTRRPFDTTDQLDDRIRRADGAFTMAYELGTTSCSYAPAPFRRKTSRPAAKSLHSPSRPRRRGPSTAGFGSALETGSEPPGDAQSIPADDQPARPGGQHRSGRGFAGRR